MSDLYDIITKGACQDAARMGAENALENRAVTGEEEPKPPLVETDEEAECLLPGYAIAFEEYHQYRAEGASPDEALQRTMAKWRALWNATAYVPHRRN